MEPVTLQWAAEKLQARIHGAAEGVAASVITDSRQVTPGALFFALPGELSDGHLYVGEAFKRGAAGAVVSREVEGAAGPVLIVPDTTQALGDLAMHYRQLFDIPVVGITGSVGKTSTKEMTAAILRTRYKTLANEKNLNTEIGVPLTLFQLDKTHEAAVIEMGMRGLGQIDRLAEIAQPSIGLITNIGLTHAELLGSQQNIAQAKSELLARLPEDGVAILPEDTPFYNYLRGRVPTGCRCLTFSTINGSKADIVIRDSLFNPQQGPQHTFVLLIGEQEYEVRMNVIGIHHGPNAAAALSVALALKVDLHAAVAALEQWQGAEGRMVVRKTADGLTVLDDCYNAGLESMSAALATLAHIALGHPAVAVLGDMRELGDYGSESHRRVGQQAGESNLRLLVTVGNFAREIEEAARIQRRESHMPPLETRHFDNSDEAAAHITKLVKSGDTVLVKGSRAMEMEKIVATLTGEQNINGYG